MLHTSCTLVTGVQTCALPICGRATVMVMVRVSPGANWKPVFEVQRTVAADAQKNPAGATTVGTGVRPAMKPGTASSTTMPKIGRDSCRARVCQYVELSVVA